jgi:phytoene synthase
MSSDPSAAADTLAAPDRLAALVRRHDPDRFLTALFAPADRRTALFALYAFNHELARAREVASEPMLALIRLQWWREVVEGAPRRHEVATPLTAAIAAGRLAPDDLLALIAARETEAEPAIPTLAAWRAYLLAGAGGLAVAAGRLLGAPLPERLRPAGAAYGAAGLLRSVQALAMQRRCLLPQDVLGAHGLVVEAVVARPTDPALRPVLAELAAEGRAFLAEAAGLRLPGTAIAAALPAVLARRDLARATPAPAARGVADRLAVTLAGLTGRLGLGRPSGPQ